MILLRSSLFWFLVTLLTIPFGVALVLLTLLPLRARFSWWACGAMGSWAWPAGCWG